jgi:hypothetical protein
MKKIALAVVAVLALAVPTTAMAKVEKLDPSVPGTAITMAQHLIASEPDLDSPAGFLSEFAFEGGISGAPTGFGDTTGGVPNGLADFPTNGTSWTILSSGDVNTIGSELVNESSSTTTSFESQEFIEGLDRGPQAEDWTVLRVNVNVPAGANCLTLDYRFFSEEFPEYVGSPYNDAFIAELDTTNWSVQEGGELIRPNDFAVSPEGSPISINGLGDTAVTAEEAEGTYFDAATGLITTKTPIAPGAHAIYLSIFDASDSILDSAVFVDNLRFINESPETCKPPTGKEIQAPPAGSPPAPPAPSSEFVIGPSIKFKKGGTKAILTIEVPGPGTVDAGSPPSGAKASAVRARLSATTSAKAKCKAKGKAKGCKVKKPLLKPSSVVATAAGPVQVVVALSGTGKALLAKKGKLTVPVQITFTPTGGLPSTQKKSVTFKKPGKKCKGAKCKKGGK